MGRYERQVECLSCSNCRSFVHLTETSQRLISPVEAALLYRQAVLTCGRCGSTSLILTWTDAMPYAPTGLKSRRRSRLASPVPPSTTRECQGRQH